jgi:hypothetical protein
MPSHMLRPWVAGRGVPTADYFSCVLFLHYVNVYMFQEYLSTVIIYIYNALGGCGTPCSHRDLGTCRFWHRRFVLHTDVLFTAYIQQCVFRAVAAWQNAWGKRNYHVSIPSVLVLLIPFPSKAIHNPYPKHANYIVIWDFVTLEHDQKVNIIRAHDSWLHTALGIPILLQAFAYLKAP